MIIKFRLQWVKGDKAGPKAFKSKEAFQLFHGYCERISKFASCEISGALSLEQREKEKLILWICDRANVTRALSSEETAQRLKQVCDAGARQLQVVIGGPNGFPKEELYQWKPDLVWSFGPLTLPHELAAVVAGEQLYRAWTILRGLPYHVEH